MDEPGDSIGAGTPRKASTARRGSFSQTSKRARRPHGPSSIASEGTGASGSRTNSISSPFTPVFGAAKPMIPPWGNPIDDDDDDDDDDDQLSSSHKNRTRHACETCRRRKTKCDGGQPVCSRCSDLGMVCIYADNKREKMKKSNEVIASKVQVYEALLLRLLPLQDSSSQLAIQTALSQKPPPSSPTTTNRSINSTDKGGEDDEWSASAEAGSPRSSDIVRRDSAGFDQSGYVGKSSTVRWMNDAKDKMMSPSSPHDGEASAQDFGDDLLPLNYGIDSGVLQGLLMDVATYHIIDLDLSEAGEHGQNVDPLAFPSREIADALVESYFTTVHPQFPIVMAPVFMVQYQSYWQTSWASSRSSNTWIAMLNLVFALGAIYGHSIRASWAGPELDHIQYFMRARILSLEPLGVLELPKMEKVQLTALTGMYLIASYQINRAWHVVGLSIRYVQSLGLHLRDRSRGTDSAEREFRARVCHAVISLERLLCFLTGRPSSILDRDVSIAAPQFLDDKNALSLLLRGTSTSSHVSPDIGTMSASAAISNLSRLPAFALSTPIDAFRAGVELDKILAETFYNLYSPDTVRLRWVNVQKLVVHLNSKLDDWRTSLPWSLRLTTDPGDSYDSSLRDRMSLMMRYFSLSMLINRPSLCEVAGREDSIPRQSEESKALDQRSGRVCTASARGVIAMLPKDPNIFQLYRSTPWWCVLHYFIQAGVILVLEIFFNVSRIPDRIEDIVSDLRKLLRWLREMSTPLPHGTMSLANRVTSRSWAAISRLLLLAIKKAGQGVQDLDGLDLDIPEEVSFSAQDGSNKLGTRIAPHESTASSGGIARDFAGRSDSRQRSAFLSVLTPFDRWGRLGDMDTDESSGIPFAPSGTPNVAKRVPRPSECQLEPEDSQLEDLSALFPSVDEMAALQDTFMRGSMQN
ncbi:MAG: hypothetical protein M4579_004717 [Chaenotheca gracillima]|nr:MAG: hypothetical protein M4579_004717 [Chaenotheca gracillima]